ncbi:MAG: prepilin-type N-terminal cleavage/methylation domain-containing protein [Desulfosarcinaceae bacterium]|nr:prepilin-type N-terminal cleavage/methylation domain-containing protein [Desulfosarcinaceae bacterium]
MKPSLDSSRGMTLIEITVAMAVTFIVAGAIFATYRTQQMVHQTQRALVEMNQNIRSAVYYLSRDLRMAGADPQWGSAANPAGAGAAILIANGNQIQFQVDWNQSGVIDNPNETIRYGINANGQLGREEGNGGLQVIAENIEAIDFEYMGYSPAPPYQLITLNPGVGTNVPAALVGNIRMVRVTIVAGSGNDPDGPVMSWKRTDSRVYTNATGTREVLGAQNDNIRRTVLTSEIQLRNM